MTLFKWDGISSSIPFVGFKNFFTVFSDSNFWASIWLTAKYVIVTVTLVNVIAFILAYLVTSGIKAQNFFRTIFFTPYMYGSLMIGFIWQFLFNRFFTMIGQKYGILLLSKTWLGDVDLAFLALVIVSVWQYVGYMMVILIAGLTRIPKDVVEAASIDGASKWKMISRIVLPLMIPSFIVTIFLSLQRGFMVYDVNYALTQGGPFGSTVFSSMYVYNQAFLRFNYGVGQAEAFILFILVMVVTLLQVGLSKRMEVEA